MTAIVTLTEQHVDSCYEIARELEQHYQYPIGGNWTREKIRDEIGQHHGFGVYDDDDKLCAFCLYRQIPGFSEIMFLATRLNCHRKGTMRALIKHLMGQIREDEGIWLEVHAENLAAIRFYEAVGFVKCGERPRYYSDGARALVFEFKHLR